MRVLVTGGCGFIGTHVIEELVARGHTPTIFDRNPHEHDQGIFLGDTRDEEAVRAAVYMSQGVIHLAGVLGTQETVNDPTTAAETNVLGGINVFKACRDMNVPGVYIAVGNHWMNNPYSISKSTAERFALMANKEWGTKIAVVRVLNAYGPGQKWEPVRKLMPNLIRAALKGDEFPVYGDGTQIMDMIYVKDAARILVDALLLDHGVYDRPFEAGTGEKTTVWEICDEVYRQLGYLAPLVDYRPMRPGEEEKAIVVGDPSTLLPLHISVDELVSLKDGLSETIPWYKEQV